MKSGSPVRGYWTNRRMTLLGSSSSIASSRYRHKEERKKLLKLSFSKIGLMKDSEHSLRKRVLIENTIRKLQKEAKEDKAARQASWRRSSTKPSHQWNGASEETETDISNSQDNSCRGRKRTRQDSTDDLAEVQTFFDMYLPPTPRMITSIDEEEENRQSKKLKQDANECSNDSSKCSNGDKSDTEDVTMSDNEDSVSTRHSSDSGKRPESESDERRNVILRELSDNTECRTQSDTSNSTNNNSNTTTTSSSSNNSSSSTKPWFYILDSERSYSCAQSSMFGELQRVVYHSLIASMES